MSPWGLPIRRPMATAMAFLALTLLGVIALDRIPVELLPPASGDNLWVNFNRPGSEPETVEREILLPLAARVGELAGIEETWGEIRGSGGSFRVRFAPGVDVRVRELDLRRVAAELAREQPRGTSIQVDSQDLGAVSRFVMFVQVTGMEDRNSLLQLVDDRIVARLSAVAGVSQVMAGGGAPLEMTVRIDPDRCAAVGVPPDAVIATLARSVQRLRFLGGAESADRRTAVVLDGRPAGPVSLADLPVIEGRPVLLRHVADVELGTGREEMLFRVNGQPTVALVVFKEEGANLVRLGRELRSRLDALREEYTPYGLDFVISFDAAELVQDQLDRLKQLALSGFLIALAVLFLFLRQWRAVGVVAVAVPVSLLVALALLFAFGQSVNLITLFGLAVGIGMLVDNSIVVYEAVQRQLERGVDPDRAAEEGVRRTVRAILAASLTNAIVFLPLTFADFDDQTTRSLLAVLAMAILLPLAGSLLVAVGLVPLLARRLAAPAALRLLARRRRIRESLAGLVRPDRPRELFGGLLVVALRRPAGWLTAVAAAVILTVIVALPWVLVGAGAPEATEADSVRFSVAMTASASLERTAGAFDRLERVAMELPGVKHVESVVREDGGALTVHFVRRDERPKETSVARVREAVRAQARNLEGVELDGNASGGGIGGGGGPTGGGGLAGLLGQGPASIVLSGPDARELGLLAQDIQARLRSIPEVDSAAIEMRAGQDEIWVLPDATALAGLGLTADQVLPVLNVIRREGVVLRTGFTRPDGREIPLVVRREGDSTSAGEALDRLRFSTPAGVLPLAALARSRKMPPPAAILHHDGRREISVSYRLGAEAPATGPARKEVEQRIRDAMAEVHRPVGYAIETPEADEGFSWFKGILVPVVLLLYAVLAVTFESLTLPLLVLLALPLTVLGATWALVFNGMPASLMALVGTLALIGLTVNPAILLVDRMQERAWKGGLGPGAAALAAVRERVRPVLMTTTTTVVGLWPLALVTGRENEIWPPFATVMMGGLITSTALTLLVVPVGFVFLHRLDRLFGRLGPWILLGWVGATAAVMTPLVQFGSITSLTWQMITTVLVAALLLGLSVLLFRRPERPEPELVDGVPSVRVSYLNKVYGQPGPVGRAWRLPERFARRVLERGGRGFDPIFARERLLPLALVLVGAIYLAASLQWIFWRIVFVFVAGALAGSLCLELRRARGRADNLGRVEPGGPEGVAAALAPWAAYAYLVAHAWLLPWAADEAVRLRPWILAVLGLGVGLVQFGRRTARRIARGVIPQRPGAGWLRQPRAIWRLLARRLFGLDLPREEVRALADVHFLAERGMIGILGPNGAGKTTLLRQLAGILDPSLGTIKIGGVPLPLLRSRLARYVGYLPQEFGLPNDLTAREYLDYYALLYEIRPAALRRERVSKLLEEVGLGDRADEKIGGYSGGMRQRVAVARTLLRLPPVIIVDEPTVGLDPRERIRFRNLLARLAEGRVVFFSTHVVEDVAVACARVIVLARGRKVFDGAPERLAGQAEGKVWELWLDAGVVPDLPPGALVVDQVPVDTGQVRARVLCGESPRADARALAPTLEDGYFWLARVGAA